MKKNFIAAFCKKHGLTGVGENDPKPRSIMFHINGELDCNNNPIQMLVPLLEQELYFKDWCFHQILADEISIFTATEKYAVDRHEHEMQVEVYFSLKTFEFTMETKCIKFLKGNCKFQGVKYTGFIESITVQ